MNIIDTLKDVVNIAQKIGNIELQKQILSLQSDALKLVDENTNLRQEVATLKEVTKIKGAIRFWDGEYFLKNDDGSEDGPFCQICWDVDQRLVPLIPDRYRNFYDYCENVRKPSARA